MTFETFQARLITSVFGPNTTADDILEDAENVNLTPQAYICDSLRIAIGRAAGTAESALLEHQSAASAICDFVGVVYG